MRTDMRTDLCTDLCTGTRLATYIDTCIDMCTGTYVDLCMRVIYRYIFSQAEDNLEMAALWMGLGNFRSSFGYNFNEMDLDEACFVFRPAMTETCCGWCDE